VVENVAEATKLLAEKKVLAGLSEIISAEDTPLLAAGIVLELASALREQELPKVDIAELSNRSSLLKIALAPNGSFDYSELIRRIENTPTPQVNTIDSSRQNIANKILELAESGPINSTLRNIYAEIKLNQLLFPEIDTSYSAYALHLGQSLYSWKELVDASTHGAVVDLPQGASDRVYGRLYAVVVPNGDNKEVHHAIDLFGSLDPNQEIVPPFSRSALGYKPITESTGVAFGTPFDRVSTRSEEDVLAVLRNIAAWQSEVDDTLVREVVGIDAKLRQLLVGGVVRDQVDAARGIQELRSCLERLGEIGAQLGKPIPLTIFSQLQVGISASNPEHIEQVKQCINKWFGCEVVTDQMGEAVEGGAFRDLSVRVFRDNSAVPNNWKGYPYLLPLSGVDRELDVAVQLALGLARAAACTKGTNFIKHLQGVPLPQYDPEMASAW
jgi:hypothetical protein